MSDPLEKIEKLGFTFIRESEDSEIFLYFRSFRLTRIGKEMGFRALEAIFRQML